MIDAAKRVPGVLSAAVSRFFATGCPQHAAGISYRVLFSLAPLAIVLVSVFGLVLQDKGLREDVIARIVDALPVDETGRDQVQRAIEGIATPASAAGLISLLAFLWAASGMMSAIRRGLETAMEVEDGRPVVRGKLVDLALVAGAALLVLLSVGLGLVAEAAAGLVSKIGLGADGSAVQRGLATGLPFLLSIVTAMLLYRFVPAARLRFRDAVAGGAVTAVLLALISVASGLLYSKASDWSLIYGSLTTVLIFLYSVYLYASALLLGASVASEWSKPPPPPNDGPGEPIGVKIRRAVRGLFVHDKPAEPEEGPPAKEQEPRSLSETPRGPSKAK